MRIGFIGRHRFLEIVRGEFENEPILFVDGIEHIINGILNTSEIDVFRFDLTTRQMASDLPKIKKVPEQSIIYTRRIIAALAFNGMLPEERKDKVNAAFAYDKSGRSAHFAAVQSDGKEKLFWHLRSVISKGRSSGLYAILNRSYDAHVSCVYGLVDAIGARGIMKSNPEYAPRKWNMGRLEEETREITKRAGDMILRCRNISKEIRQLYGKVMAQI